MSPDTETRILVTLSEIQTGQTRMQREIETLSAAINSTNGGDGLSEKARESIRDRASLHVEVGEVWESIDEIKQTARDNAENLRTVDSHLSGELRAEVVRLDSKIATLAAAPGAYALSVWDKLGVGAALLVLAAVFALVGKFAH